MDWGTLAGFALAALMIAIVPGPGVMSIVGCAIGSGRRAALASVAGMAAGNAIAMTLSLAGVGALLATSASAFAAIKWLGALYLVGLGLATLLKAPAGSMAPAAAPLTPRAAFASTVLVGTFHPKTIVFFVAFVPHFIDPQRSYAAQAALLVAVFCGVVAASDAAYALAAARAARQLRSPRARLWSRRAGGGVLIASGIATATARQ